MQRSLLVICVLAGIVIGCGSSMLFSNYRLSAKNPPALPKFEYKCAYSSKRVQEVVVKANKLGREGWDGFGVGGTAGALFVCFKRALK